MSWVNIKMLLLKLLELLTIDVQGPLFRSEYIINSGDLIQSLWGRPGVTFVQSRLKSWFCHIFMTKLPI